MDLKNLQKSIEAAAAKQSEGNIVPLEDIEVIYLGYKPRKYKRKINGVKEEEYGAYKVVLSELGTSAAVTIAIRKLDAKGDIVAPTLTAGQIYRLNGLGYDMRASNSVFFTELNKIEAVKQ